VRIICPSCDATYETPGPVAAGKVVQCARCSTRWTPVVAVVVPPAVTPPSVTPAPIPPAVNPALVELPPLQPRAGASLARELPAFRPAPRARVAVLAWTLSLALLGAAAAATVAYRAPIMQAWPPSQRAYAALGLG